MNDGFSIVKGDVVGTGWGIEEAVLGRGRQALNFLKEMAMKKIGAVFGLGYDFFNEIMDDARVVKGGQTRDFLESGLESGGVIHIILQKVLGEKNGDGHGDVVGKTRCRSPRGGSSDGRWCHRFQDPEHGTEQTKFDPSEGFFSGHGFSKDGPEQEHDEDVFGLARIVKGDPDGTEPLLIYRHRGVMLKGACYEFDKAVEPPASDVGLFVVGGFEEEPEERLGPSTDTHSDDAIGKRRGVSSWYGVLEEGIV